MKSLLSRLADSAPVRHAVLTFAATFGLALLGFLNDVQSVMATGGHFPSVAILAKAGASALAGAATGLVAWVVQKAQGLLSRQPAA